MFLSQFIFFKHELLPLNAYIYIENGSKINFSPITCLLGLKFHTNSSRVMMFMIDKFHKNLFLIKMGLGWT